MLLKSPKSVPVIPLAPVASVISSDPANPSSNSNGDGKIVPSTHLSKLLSIVENSKLDLDDLVSDVVVKIGEGDEGIDLVGQEIELRTLLLELAERKSYGLAVPNSAEQPDGWKTDNTENACWFWESKVLDFLPKETLGKLVRPARAFRKKIGARVKATGRVIDALVKTPGLGKKIKDEVGKLMKIRTDDKAKEEAAAAKEKEKRDAAVKREEEKEKIRNLKEEAGRINDMKKLKVKEEKEKKEKVRR
jgi:hypothetical protein